jgi:hypothetical protein
MDTKGLIINPEPFGKGFAGFVSVTPLGLKLFRYIVVFAVLQTAHKPKSTANAKCLK